MQGQVGEKSMGIPEDYLDQLKKIYPSRQGHQGWEQVRVLVPRLCFTWSIPWETVLQGTKNYKATCDAAGKTGGEYVMSAAKFYNDRDRLVCEYAEMDMRTPQDIQAEAKWTELDARAAALGVSLNRDQGYDYALQGLVDAERKALNKRWEAAGMNAPKFAVVK
jgi:hypothetical protein